MNTSMVNQISLDNVTITLTMHSLWQNMHGNTPGFDIKVQLITFLISCNLIRAFVHWAKVDDYRAVIYNHSSIYLWSLQTGCDEWQKARSALQKCIQWVMKKNESSNALRFLESCSHSGMVVIQVLD